MTTAIRERRRAVGTPMTRVDGRDEGHRRGDLRLRVPVERRRLSLAAAGHHRPRAGDRDGRRPPRTGGAGGAGRADPGNAPRLTRFRTTRSWSCCSPTEVAYRGQIIGAVVAETLEAAAVRGGPGAGRATSSEPPDVVLREDRRRPLQAHGRGPVRAGRRRTPDGSPAEASTATPTAALAAAHRAGRHVHHADGAHQPDGAARRHRRLGPTDGLTVYCSTRARTMIRALIAAVFGLDAGARCGWSSPHVGGGFGSKVLPARVRGARRDGRADLGRPVKFALTRQQMFALVGYRPPSIQRIRLGADADGRLTAIDPRRGRSRPPEAKEYADQTAVRTRLMYAAPAPAHHPPAGAAGHAGADDRCGRPARRRACSRWSRRWTSWPSSCEHGPGRAADPQRAGVDPESATAVLAAAIWWPVCARAPRRFGWARRDPTPRAPARGALAGRAPAWPPPPTRPARLPATSATAGSSRTGTARCGSPPPTSGTGALDGADPDRRGRARCAGRAGASCEIGRAALGPAPFAGGSLGHSMLGLGDRQGVPRAADGCWRARRRRGPGRRPGGAPPTCTDGRRTLRAVRDVTPSGPSSRRSGWTRTPARSG